MKKFILVLLAFVTVYSCQKKEMDVGQQEVEVVFGIDDINPDNDLKTGGSWICPADGDGNLLEPASAWIEITDGVTPQYLNPAVFRLDGKLYTQAIKLEAIDGAAKTYTVTKFLLYDDVGNTIMATPTTGSDYSEYVSQGVPFDFYVNAFEKAQVPVEVLCYFPETHDYFGFTWFNVTEIVVREFCFYGDICLNGEPYTPADFESSMYGTGLGVDVPAIMEIVVRVDGELVPNNDLFNNEATLGIGAPLCVQFPDRLNVQGEVFTFELYLWLPDASGFSYQLYATYTSTDDGVLMLDDGTTPADTDDNGIMEFVVGTCNYSDTDQTFEWLYTPPCINQSFEVDAAGWFDQDDAWYGEVNRVSSGTNGITSSSGSNHAIFEGDASSGPFTRYCGYSDTWTGTWKVETDVYLDPTWTDGQGFEISVAANNTSNSHRRDFIFHITKDNDATTDNILIAGTNNTNFSPRQDLATMNHWVISAAGWYTFQHLFYDNGGVLAVDLNLLDSGGNILWTETRSDPSDLIPSVVGGNRYGWFTCINVTDGIAVDETKMYRP